MDDKNAVQTTKIKQLSDESSVSILSSYTIFSPASAIKELIDNALDSRATIIEIEVDHETFGLNYLSVKDNGTGILKNDRELICLKGTTSRISSLQDINIGMSSLGFRGEALHYLAALSSSKNYKNGFNSMSITTKTEHDPVGEKWCVDYEGKINSNTLQHISTKVGTSIVILGLFNNLPVRKKLLMKKRQVVIQSIRQLIIDYAFINCKSVKFQLKLVKLNSKNELVKQSNKINNLDLVFNSNISYSQFLNYLTSIRNCSKQFLIIENMKFCLDWNVTCLLPIMKLENSITTFKKSIRAVLINRRPMCINFGIGKQVCRNVISAYQTNQLLVPSIFFIQIDLNENSNNSNLMADINIEPQKNNILLKDQVMLVKDLNRLLCKIIFDSHYSQDSNNIISEPMEKEYATTKPLEGLIMPNKSNIGNSNSIPEHINILENSKEKEFEGSRKSRKPATAQNQRNDEKPDLNENIGKEMIYNEAMKHFCVSDDPKKDEMADIGDCGSRSWVQVKKRHDIEPKVFEEASECNSLIVRKDQNNDMNTEKKYLNPLELIGNRSKLKSSNTYFTGKSVPKNKLTDKAIRRNKALLPGSLRYKLKINQETTNNYIYRNPWNEHVLFDPYVLFKSNEHFRTHVANYDIKKIDSFSSFNHFIYKLCSHNNSSCLNESTIKISKSASGWQIWSIQR